MTALPSGLPPAVDAFFAAKNAHDADAVACTFTEGARVEDDGKTYRGRQEIRDWSDKESGNVQIVLTVTEATRQGREAVVTAQAAGKFDGSPLPFLFRFQGTDDDFDAIAHLAIDLAR
ncbi:nuclear transport factor 2 family protein [Streptomyces sp. NPDC092369]|uniref:nuclear transport factor 2 family protein n=1 Tax=Streptomyces sp. NPDC092369 TaxID=3366015 RepID=UPI003815A8CE